MKKLLKEFKAFISRGNVMDLAVGMIIGAAFTAIISAVVNGILKPLINLIPIGETGLQTVLRQAVVAEDGTVLTEALILDWGGVISAVISVLAIMSAFDDSSATACFSSSLRRMFRV